VSQHDYGDDDDNQEIAAANRVYKEFNCPECTAHNPYDQGFKLGDEITCFYCGLVFEVRESGGKLKFREA
jgi:hypothetical protein